MIDSVLKGTGNSRFLKSAVPAGTSWADALAMLQAGTFPVDFNGINTEGFQQIGTPLNKANLLKDATAAQIGLPPSTTPDGMFRAFGNTGELHVWRKTVVSDKAGYTLGSNKNLIVYQNSQGYAGDQYTAFWSVSASVTVDSTGKVSLSNPTEVRVNWTEGETDMKGKFIQFSRVGHSTTSVGDTTGIYYIPTSAQFQKANSAVTILDAQPVNGYAQGTTTTYPVSTNPNAYQEGSDAKPAGYTLGEVVTSKVKLGYSRSSSGMFYYYADTLSVSDDGTVSISTQNSYQVNRNSNMSNLKTAMAGKFIQLYGSSGSAMELSGPFSTIPGEIVFIPADTSFNTETIRGDDYFTIDRYQPVTGYAAIPAVTTIEYLGKLGDKARVQVVSYVGTGTYGADNPNSLTFDFVPKVVIISKITADSAPWALFLPPILSGTYSRRAYNITGVTTKQTDSFAKINKKTLSWFSTDGFTPQLNSQSDKYTAIAIG